MRPFDFSAQYAVLASLVCILVLPAMARALGPDEVLVVANKNAARSVGLAKYYMQKRGIPENNLLQIWVTDQEGCSRSAYEKKIAPPIRRYLTEDPHGKKIRCLLLMYGVPMKVAGPPLTAAEKEELQGLKAQKKELTAELEQAAEDQQSIIHQELNKLKRQLAQEQHALNRSASVDSELALIKDQNASLSFWQPNPFFVGYRDRDLPIPKKGVLMVSRLDGPTSDTVKRIITDSLATEKKGLTGTAYFDARWPRPKKNKQSGYAFYDQSIHRAADRIRQMSDMKVVEDDRSRLFQPGECPHAALYCGWYKLAHYVDAFDWQPGAVGYHIASSECSSLKRGDYWCKRMLEDGVAATLGPVGEPYVQAFPIPEIFFAYLLDGNYSLAEVYLLSNPFWSWKMVLIGDPLYRPFGSGSRRQDKN